VLAAAAEKGTWWCVLRVRGTAGHASRPLRTDNALVKAAEVVRRVAAFRPRAQTGGVWRRYVDSMGFDPSTRDGLLDPERVYDVCADLPDLGLARLAHACTHTTLAPTVIHGGSKINVIPDTVEVEVDVRTLPGQTDDDVRAILTEALGDLAGEVEIVRRAADAANTSPVDTPLWAAMERATSRLSPGAAVVPAMMAGASDARFFRRLGATCYGFGLHSGRIPYSELTRMYHGNDERVDVESLRLTTELWDVLVRDFLG
jgi:acetylornithine deacetylase/succinyl-diaminopimelate desuccinylase-like protein